MKKTSIFFLAFAAAGFMMFTGCKKEYQTVTLGVELESAPNGSKVEIDANHNPVFLNGDNVNVNGVDYPITVSSGKYVVDVQSCTTGYYAAYPASLVASETGFSGTTNQAVHMRRWQTYKFEERDGVRVQDVQLPSGAYIAANDNGKKLKFYNFCSLLEVEWKNTSTSDAYDIIGIEVTVPGAALYGDGNVTLNGTSSSMTLSDVHKNRVNLDITETQRETVAAGATSSKYYVVLPTFTGQVTVRIQTMKHAQTSLDDQKLKTVTVQTSGNVTMPRNMIVPIHVEAAPKEDNSLTGYFSVRGDGHGNDTYKVVFSRGNLQHIGSASNYTTGWKFADRQYDFFGAANMASGNYSFGNSQDLFSWSGTDSRYGLQTYDWWYNDGDWRASETFVDWGVNEISGDVANTWYTLSSAEWFYLLHTRVGETGDNLRGKARITGIADHPGVATLNGAHRTVIEGFILVPDDWTADDIPSGLSFVPASDEDTMTHNIYTVEQWARMEAAGAMFLPAAGYGSYYGSSMQTAEGNEILDAFAAGHYWTQTKPRDGFGEADYLAFQYNYYYWHLMVSHALVGNSTDANFDSQFWYLRSVRLVKPAPGYTRPTNK